MAWKEDESFNTQMDQPFPPEELTKNKSNKSAVHPEPFDSPFSMSLSKGKRFAQDRLVEGATANYDTVLERAGKGRRWHPFRACGYEQYRVITGWALLLLLPLALAACKGKTAPPAPPPPEVTVARPLQQTVTDSLELTGNTQAVYTVQLVARVAGYLEMVFFQDGQLVRQGQSLFRIQQDTYQDAVRQAEGQVALQKAQLDYAEKQLARYSNLLQQRATSQENVDNWRYQRDSAQANLKVAEAALDLAKLNLSYTHVTAPFDGRIDRRLQDPGNLVGAGENTVLAQLNQIDPIYVYFNISDADLARLMAEAHWQPGQAPGAEWPVFVGLLDEDGYPHKGKLDFASISLTPTTGTLLLRGTLPNRDGKILPGLYARVQVPVKRGRVLMVPQEAIGYDQRGSYVLTVNEDKTVQRMGVKTGALVDHLRVINEGLTGKEWVVFKGIQKAIPGRPVTPERQNPGTPAKIPHQPSRPGGSATK